MTIRDYQPTVSEATPAELRQWLDALHQAVASCGDDADLADLRYRWPGLSLREHFDRLTLLCQAGLPLLAQGDKKLENRYQETIRWCLHDQLNELYEAASYPDASTLVSAFLALMAYHPLSGPAAHGLSLLPYHRFFAFFDPLFAATSRNTPAWHLLSSVKQAYQNSINPK